jgi:hypothetical protein
VFVVTVKAIAVKEGIDNVAKIGGGGDPVCVLDGQDVIETADATINDASRCSSNVIVNVVAPKSPNSGLGLILRSVATFVLLGIITAGIVWSGTGKMGSTKSAS